MLYRVTRGRKPPKGRLVTTAQTLRIRRNIQPNHVIALVDCASSDDSSDCKGRNTASLASHVQIATHFPLEYIEMKVETQRHSRSNRVSLFHWNTPEREREMSRVFQ